MIASEEAVEQDTELESALSAWEADVLPTIRILQVWAEWRTPPYRRKRMEVKTVREDGGVGTQDRTGIDRLKGGCSNQLSYAHRCGWCNSLIAPP